MLKIKIPTNQTYPFKSVNIGDLFEYNNNCYMKIETANYPEDCSIQVNAVNLKNGQLARFLSDNQIYFLDAEMTVTRRDMSPYEK
jgi:hypothetical protein